MRNLVLERAVTAFCSSVSLSTFTLGVCQANELPILDPARAEALANHDSSNQVLKDFRSRPLQGLKTLVVSIEAASNQNQPAEMKLNAELVNQLMEPVAKKLISSGLSLKAVEDKNIEDLPALQLVIFYSGLTDEQVPSKVSLNVLDTILLKRNGHRYKSTIWSASHSEVMQKTDVLSNFEKTALLLVDEFINDVEASRKLQ